MSFGSFVVEEESERPHGQGTCPSYRLALSACIGVHLRLKYFFAVPRGSVGTAHPTGLSSVRVFLRTTTSSNLVFLRKFSKGYHVNHGNQKNYVSRRDAGTQGRQEGCGSLISAPPRLCARRFWLRPSAARPRWGLRALRGCKMDCHVATGAERRCASGLAMTCLDSRVRGNDKRPHGLKARPTRPGKELNH